MTHRFRWTVMVTVVIGLCWGCSVPGWAETAYIVDSIKVALRAGPGNDQKSVGMTESGQSVEIVNSGEEWALIRLGSGVEGYLLNRYLTNVPPARFRLDQLQEKTKALTAQAAGLVEENARLKAENDRLATALAAEEKETAALKGEFDAFRKDAAEVVTLKSKADALAAELGRKTEEIDRLRSGPLAILENENLYWFLAGAAVLLVGFLAGYVVKRPRRWSTLG